MGFVHPISSVRNSGALLFATKNIYTGAQFDRLPRLVVNKTDFDLHKNPYCAPLTQDFQMPLADGLY